MTAASGSVALSRVASVGRRDRTARSSSARIAGAAGLAAAVGGSLWLAAGAAHGGYLLELPTHARPPWIEGPLHGLGTVVGPLGPSAVSVAMIVLCGAYLVALGCAQSIPLRFAMAAIVLANLAFTLGPTIVSSDVFGYITYAREAAHGLNPYVFVPSSIAHDGILQFVYWKHQTSPYGPLFTALSAPLGLVSGAVALWIYKAAAGVAAVATAWLVADLAHCRGSNPTRAAVFVGLNPVLLLYAVSGAHNDLLGTLLVVCAIALTLSGREIQGAGVAVAAAAIKLTLGLALPFVIVGARRRGAALAGAGVALVVVGAPTLLLAGTHLFDQLQRIAGDPRFDIAFSGPDRLATALGTQIDGVVRALCSAGAAAAALVMLARALRGADATAAAGWAFLALIASIASLAPWYLVWLLPLAAIARNRALWIAAILATAYLIAVHVPAVGGQPWLSAPATHLRAHQGMQKPRWFLIDGKPELTSGEALDAVDVADVELAGPALR